MLYQFIFCSTVSLNSTILLQPIQFLVSLIFLSIFISWKSQYHDITSNDINRVFNYITLGYPTVILLIGVLNIYFCFINWSWKIKIIPSSSVQEFKCRDPLHNHQLPYRARERINWEQSLRKYSV